MAIHRDVIHSVLRAAFPDPHVAIGAEAVDAVATAMLRQWQPEFERYFGVPQPETSSVTDPAPSDGDAAADYYVVHATHARPAGPAAHEFTAQLPAVRISLRETPDDIQTGMGWAYGGDRLLGSLPDVRNYLQQVENLFGEAPEIDACDLVTPPRLYGCRFGAIAVYLLLRHGEVVGRVLEGGMATGQPRVLYWLPGAGPVVRRTFYEPTPDSGPRYFYRASVTLEAPAEPGTLTIERLNDDPRKVASTPVVVRIIARFERRSSSVLTHPGELLLQAACRVALVAQALGKELPGVGVLTPVLAEIGKSYSWTERPGQ